MSEVTEKKIKATHIIIAILVIIALLQTVALVRQGHRQAVFEKTQRERMAPSQDAASALRSRAYPMAPRGSHAAPRSFTNENPWAEFDAMSQRMNNLMKYALMFGGPASKKMFSEPEAGSDFTPAVDLEETKDAYIVRSDLPGLEKDKINLTVRDNVLMIEGMRETTNETQDPKSGYYAQERSYGSFARSLNLPGPVDESKIVAAYKNGVLTITLPKIPGRKDIQKVAIQ